jgi:hypothetical protein
MHEAAEEATLSCRFAFRQRLARAATQVGIHSDGQRLRLRHGGVAFPSRGSEWTVPATRATSQDQCDVYCPAVDVQDAVGVRITFSFKSR